MSVNYTITIAVDPDDVVPQGGKPGTFVYTPAKLLVDPGDTIEWRADHPFVISFQEGTPVGDMELTGDKTDDTHTTGQQTVPEGKQGRYHYAVALWNGDRVFIDASCPHIIVS